MQKRITDDLHDLLKILPPGIGMALTAANRTDDLLEVILDLGRVPSARYIDAELRLLETEISHDDINFVVSRVGDFDADNRAGIERTLHRISAIRNRRGHIVGLTCRVGRAVYGTTEIIKDLIESGKSILLLGKPGVGKCVTADSLILGDRGLQPLADLIPDGLGEDQFAPIRAAVYGLTGLEPASHAYHGGLAKTRRVTTRHGFSLEGTPEHPLLALTATGELAFRRLDQLRLDDQLAIQRGQQSFGNEIRLPLFEFAPRAGALDGNFPASLSEDLGRFLGYLVATGTLASHNQVAFSDADPEIQADMAGLTEALFGLRLRRHMPRGRWNGRDFRILGARLRRFLAHLGLQVGPAGARGIPPCILTAPKPIVTAFLRAWFEGNGSLPGPDGRVEIRSASRDLLAQLHVLLLNYGIVGQLRAEHDPHPERDEARLTLVGENVRRFAAEIGFLSTAKRSRLAKLAMAAGTTLSHPKPVSIPHQMDGPQEWRSPAPRSRLPWPGDRAWQRAPAAAGEATSDPAPPALGQPPGATLFFDPAVRIEEGEAYVYDLSVPGTHSFFANGFISHNTTMLREAARILADEKRVVIVDTSNEIGGDGDVPHPAVGSARRMQVAQPSLQHEVMIEGVENHNPEVIVIDEIGRELEAAAARTIAERGVQLIGTAHGNTLDNILLNPTLADLVGGIESVTLSDEEARRRGTQKTVLERRAPPTFDVLIEIRERDRVVIHPDVAGAVDGLLRGRPAPTELRYADEDGTIRTETAAALPSWKPTNGRLAEIRARAERVPFEPSSARHPLAAAESTRPGGAGGRSGAFQPVSVYAYGLTRQRLEQAARRLRLPLNVVDDIDQAQALVTLKTYYRRHQRPISDAEERSLPIYVLRSNTVNQMENFLTDLFSVEPTASNGDDALNHALHETQAAIEAVLNGSSSIDLSPQSAPIRRRQHEMIRQAQLISHSYGKEPYRRVRIFRE